VSIATTPDAATVWRPSAVVDAALTLSLLRHGKGDPCHQNLDGAIWRASRMPSGPVSYRITQPLRDEIHAQAWGPGAPELIAGLPELLGAADPVETFEPPLPIVADAHHRHPGLRMPRTMRLTESLVPAILEQKVVGKDAFASWRRLVLKYGEAAPGPVPLTLRLPPDAETFRKVPSWEWHRAGVDPKRARAVVATMPRVDALQRAAETRAPEELYRMLRSLPGIGVWTAAEVGYRVLGDPDAIPIGDYHLAPLIGWVLQGRRDLGHDEVEPLVEGWRPHRFRVVRLLELAGAAPPRRGPRMSRVDHRAI
jgi:3-methyladenine DNA glycosylase/8-oxoguanine DNA glycosylase